MSQQPPKRPEQGDEDPRGTGGEPSFNWRGLILLSVAVMLVAMAFMWKGRDGSTQDLLFPRFVAMVEASIMESGGDAGGKTAVAGAGEAAVGDETPEGSGDPADANEAAAQPMPLRKIDKSKPLQIVINPGTMEQTLVGGFLPEKLPDGKAEQPEKFRVLVNLDFQRDVLLDLMEKGGLTYTVEYKSSMFGNAMLAFLPVFLLLLLLYFFFRQQMRMAGRGAMSFGKSKAKMLTMEKNKVTFKNVAGVDEAKEEVWELVEFLKDPKKFQRLGGRIPKGVLMVGAPGTGKTLLARAIAGEADVPFFSISGSDFVEMFVGVGASRVRDMFEQGKRNAPCLIFIDEIDAVGRHRGHGLGGGHDEREQTLNALLVEMDGFDTQEGVIIIAATNRPDVLDPALLRPGRFDRQVTVGLPDVKGREEILEVHAKKVKMDESVDLGVVARGTPGYSGAELANVINEAALLAARKGLKAITLPELEEARDKVRWGRERRSLAISEKEKENTAYHEAGHAILLEILEHTEPLHKVTIIPRGPSLGSTMWLPEEDKYNMRKREILDALIVDMGGRVAEEIIFGDVTSGASGDIKMATDLSRKMVCQWGMSEELGMVEYGDHQEHVFLARDMGGGGRNYSEDTAEKIDREVKRIIDNAYQKAKDLLMKHRKELDIIAKALLEFETLDGSHIRDIMEFGEMKNPPASPRPPEPPVELSSGSKKKKEGTADSDGDDPLPGDLAPAGA